MGFAYCLTDNKPFRELFTPLYKGASAGSDMGELKDKNKACQVGRPAALRLVEAYARLILFAGAGNNRRRRLRDAQPHLGLRPHDFST